MRSGLSILLLTLFARCAWPQTVPSADAIQVAGVTITGSLRSRLYDWDWFQPTSGNNNYVYSGNLLRVAFSQRRDTWDWNVELALPFLLGLPSNATGTGPQQGGLGFGSNYLAANGGSNNTAMIFPKQAYVRFDGLGGDKRHSLQIGRFEFQDGSETAPKNTTLAALKRDRISARLIGPFGFSDVGRSFDGLHYAYATASDNITFVAAVATRGVFQVDGWGWNQVGFGYAAYTHDWAAGRLTGDTRLFVIEYDDWRPVLKVDNRPLAARRAELANMRINTFGGHSVQAMETGAGTIDFLVWGAAQTGRWGVQQQRAGAFDVEAGFQPKLLPKLKPWLRGGYYWGSGDDNPSDDTHGTFFQLLPTPRPFARFPFFNMMNNLDAFGILILRPHPKLTISSEFHSLRLAAPNDLWYSGGGVFQPWTFGYVGRSTSGRRSLGNLYDLSADYRVARNLTLSGYAGYTQGLASLEQIYPLGKDGAFGYLEALYRF
ncbi:MAG TPA: alginate export family protein [Bryobacteraceae bacterium]|nr:alginate export family protein [Bryobacteraceae bacterium]